MRLAVSTLRCASIRILWPSSPSPASATTAARLFFRLTSSCRVDDRNIGHALRAFSRPLVRYSTVAVTEAVVPTDHDSRSAHCQPFRQDAPCQDVLEMRPFLPGDEDPHEDCDPELDLVLPPEWDDPPPAHAHGPVYCPEKDVAGLEDADSPIYLELSKPVAEDADYGEWRRLGFLPNRLLYESRILEPPDQGRGRRLVDIPENANDISLWACLLNFCYRRDGSSGAARILQGMKDRGTPLNVKGPIAKKFWGTLLAAAIRDTAVGDERLLDRVWDYAHWMQTERGILWPSLYLSVISYFLDTRWTHGAQRGQKLVRWHLRLDPQHGPDAALFTWIMKRFITHRDPDTQDMLRALYRNSAHRNLYDEVIPFLYAQGTHILARAWRRLFVLHGDHPKTEASRSFLRFLAGYFPADPMSDQELLVAGLERTGLESLQAAKEVAKDDRGRNLLYMQSRSENQTVESKSKAYNDGLGARWFASSWVTINFGIEMIRLVGVNEIGPLSLQAIALREPEPERILYRVEQLKMAGISTGSSSYAIALRLFANNNDQELLKDLLYSDFHPDVFDDYNVVRRLMIEAVKKRDWRTYRMLSAVHLATSLDTAALASNYILRSCVAHIHLSRLTQITILAVLDDMSTHGVRLSPSTSDAISMHIFEAVSKHRWGHFIDFHFYMALCRRMMAGRFPIAAQALRSLLQRLGREYRMTDLERMSIDVVRRYIEAHRAPEQNMLNIHLFDVPLATSDASWASQSTSHRQPQLASPPPLLSDSASVSAYFQPVPRDLGLNHPLHPVSLIFEGRLTQAIVRWGFRYALNRPPDSSVFSRRPALPEQFGFARGIRLLAILRTSGVYLSSRQIRASVMLRLAELYSEYRELAPTQKPPGWKGRRKRTSYPLAVNPGEWALNQLTLAEAKALCDEAWGRWRGEGPLLPELGELETHIKEWGVYWINTRTKEKRRREMKKMAARGMLAKAAEREALVGLDREN